jgi:hypothetical protein
MPYNREEPGRDHDGDGDYDEYDYMIDQIMMNPETVWGRRRNRFPRSSC